MRFLARSLTGLMLVVLTLGLIALAVDGLRRAQEEREAAVMSRPPGAERVFAVHVAQLEPQTARPVLTAYGDLASARDLEVRAETSGTLVELAPGFRDGGTVAAGEVLYRIDPAEAEAGLALAETDLAAARAEEAEAEIGLDLAREDMAAAERQRDLRAQALARADDLRARAVGIAADHEAAELALSSAEQVVTGRKLALAQAGARIERAGIDSRRAGIAHAEAVRELAATEAVAPFAGMLSDVNAVPGGLVSANEQLGQLFDPAELEVAFRLSNAEFARLAGRGGELPPLEVSIALDVDGIELAARGRLDRAGAGTGAGQTGRLVYARLELDRPGLLRPGDFVTVRVSEPALQDVAVVPATAVSPDGRILLVGADDRLEEIDAAVLRRQGDSVILADVPFGRSYVTERLPQTGPGVRVRAVAPEPDGAEATGEQMVRLSPERRAGLIATVQASRGMPDDAKARILAALEADEVPKAMIDRLEARGG